MSRTRPRRSKTRRANNSRSGPKCPTPRKLAFSSREHAEDFMRHAHYQGKPRRPERAYKCPGCGAWHLTSRPERTTP